MVAADLAGALPSDRCRDRTPENVWINFDCSGTQVMIGFDTVSDQLIPRYNVDGQPRLGGVDGVKITLINKLREIADFPFFQNEQLYIPICKRP